MSAYANIARALGSRGARLGRPRDDLHRDARRHRGRSRRRAAAARRLRGHRLDGPPRADRGDARGPPSSRSSSPRATRSSSPARTARRRRPAMIAFALARDRATTRPGSSAASCRSSAATPAAATGGSSSRATSPTARSFELRPQLAVVTNIELDHHAAYGSVDGAAATSLDAWLEGAETRSRLGARSGRRSRSPCPASTTAGTPPRARGAPSGRRRASRTRKPRSHRSPASSVASSSSASAAASR